MKLTLGMVWKFNSRVASLKFQTKKFLSIAPSSLLFFHYETSFFLQLKKNRFLSPPFVNVYWRRMLLRENSKYYKKYLVIEHVCCAWEKNINWDSCVPTYHVHRKWRQKMFADVLQNECSRKFRKFYRKTLVAEPLFNKVASFEFCNFIKRDSNTGVLLRNL